MRQRWSVGNPTALFVDEAQADAGEGQGPHNEPGDEQQVNDQGLLGVAEVVPENVVRNAQDDDGAVADSTFPDPLLVAGPHANVGVAAGREEGDNGGGQDEKDDVTQHGLLP